MKWLFFLMIIAANVALAQVADQNTAPVAEEKRIVKLLSVRMDFPEKTKYQLRLYNYEGDQLLWSQDGKSQGEGELFMIDPQPYVKYGLKKFQLQIAENKNKKVDTIFFRIDPNGNVIKE